MYAVGEIIVVVAVCCFENEAKKKTGSLKTTWQEINTQPVDE